MTYDEESYILDGIAQIKAEVHQNNLLLRQICNVINTYLANHNNENKADFNRNVIANLISGVVDFSGRSNKRG